MGPDSTTVLGFTCPLCHSRVEVLRSTDSLTTVSPQGFISECTCGYIRTTGLHEVQGLEIWKTVAVTQ